MTATKTKTKTKTEARRKLTWIPDLPDFRDHIYSKPLRNVLLSMPSAVDLRPKASPVVDQGPLGSCTGCAYSSMLELLDKRKRHVDVSRLFVYYLERLIENSTATDDGAYIRDGIKALADYGWCSEKTWPYDIRKFAKRPPPSAFKEASRRKIKEYLRIVELDDMRSCLAQGYSFVFGFSVYDSFMSAEVARTGIVPMPKSSEELLGGHAVHAVGYDDRQQRFIVQNSWGTEWGDAGYFYMPYLYIDDKNMADDMWTIRA